MIRQMIYLYDRIATASRRLKLPHIPSRGYVVDIGCGSHPNLRAHFACDGMPEDAERSSPLVIDRPFVWANVEKLPFKNKAFSYSIFSHVLEHVVEPDSALNEIQRVSESGYIETPNAFYEFVIPHTYHVSRVTLIDSKLTISPKKKWDETLEHAELSDVLHDMRKNWWDLHHTNAKALLTQYYWKNTINYQVLGKIDPLIKDEEIIKAHSKAASFKDDRGVIRLAIIFILRKLFRPKRFPKMEDVLACPKCVGINKGQLVFNPNILEAKCLDCETVFSSLRGHLDFRV